MTKAPINLLLIFGGRSCEHAVSVTSAQSLLAGLSESIEQDAYQCQLIGITEQGHWRWSSDGSLNEIVKGGMVNTNAGIGVTPDVNHLGKFLNVKNGKTLGFTAEVVFPLLHGSFGEDGTIQGLLEILGLPYIGCGVAASANGMDKLISKQLFDAAMLPQAKYVAVTSAQWHGNGHENGKVHAEAFIKQVNTELRYPIFVKPANMGSSVGIRKVSDSSALTAAIEHALAFDHKVLLENSFENCAEVECAVLGNDAPIASEVGEIRPAAAFYDYDAKYLDDASSVIIPAPISAKARKSVQSMAITAFKAIDGSGLARVDFFVDNKTEEVFINEINTMPGFTPISMYPKLMQASGLPYAQLIAKMIELAFERFDNKNTLKRSYIA